MLSAHSSSNDMTSGHDQMDFIDQNGHYSNILQEQLLEMDKQIKNELNTNGEVGNDITTDNVPLHHQQEYYDQNNRNNEHFGQPQDSSAYGSIPVPSNPFFHEHTSSIIHTLENDDPSVPSIIGSGYIPKKSCLSHGDNTIGTFNTKNQRENAPRLTRESVLRRLSDALLRKSLTLVSNFDKYHELEKLCL